MHAIHYFVPVNGIYPQILNYQIKTRGIPDEPCFPYAGAFPDNHIWKQAPHCTIGPNRDARAVKITNYGEACINTEFPFWIASGGAPDTGRSSYLLLGKWPARYLRGRAQPSPVP